MTRSGNGTTYQAEQFIIHEKYKKMRRRNDIGLIRLSKDIEFIVNKLFSIHLADTDPAVNESVFVAGWGRIEVRY